MAGKIERKTFERLEDVLGPYVSLFVICAYTDTIYRSDIECDDWDDYLSQLGDDSCKHFKDGNTDIQRAILCDMDQEDRWETIWGSDYTESEYKRLDELYRIMTAQIDTTNGAYAQQEDTARQCAMMKLQQEKLFRNISDLKVDVDEKRVYTAIIKDLDKMVRDNLKDCNMRKDETLPEDEHRIDGFVDALQRKYNVSTSMTKDQVMEAFYSFCRRKKYSCTADAVEQALLYIVRTMAINNDMPEPAYITEEGYMDSHASEFEAEPDIDEKRTYESFGLVRGGARKG